MSHRLFRIGALAALLTSIWSLSFASVAFANFSNYRLPWASGVTGYVTQKDGSGHTNQVDFDIQGSGVSGDVYAAKPGTVVFVKQSSNTNCTASPDVDDSCWRKANMIVIQHSSSEFSWYVHLAYHSAAVSVGDAVGLGRKIATEGNTGYSLGVHLHFMTSTGYTGWTDPNDPNAAPWATGITPVDFAEASWSSLTAGQSYVSQNSGTVDSCAPQLTEPQDGAILSSDTPTFAWSAVTACSHDGYTFRIRTDTNFDDPGGNHLVDTGVGGTSYVPSGADASILAQHHGQTLYWAVRTANPPGQWSSRSFSITSGGGCGDPGAGEVTLYADTGYGGTCVRFGVGDYANPGALGSIGNDNAESIKVGSGTTVTLCQDDNYSGTCVTLTGSVDNLDNTSVHRNQISSMRVRGPGCGDPGADQVTIYADQNYGGTCATLGQGDYPNPASIGIGNDNAESIRVGANAQALLCYDDNFSGTCTTIQYSVADLASVGFGDNQLSSMKVQGRADTTPPSAWWNAPSDGATVSSQTLSLDAHAADSGGSGLQSVSFSAKWSGSWHGITTVYVSGSDAGASYTWDLCASGVPDGDVELGLQAADVAGNQFVYSEHSANHHVTKTFDCRPPEPTNLAATVLSSTSIALSWTDNSGGAAWYVVDRWAATDWQTIATLGAGETGYVDEALAPGTQYEYRVGAANSTGTRYAASPVTAATLPSATHFRLSLANPFVAGTGHTVTVTALDAYGNVASGYRGTIHFTSSDPAAILPANYTFTAADGGTHQFRYAVGLKTAGTRSVRATDTVTASITGTVSVTVTPA